MVCPLLPFGSTTEARGAGSTPAKTTWALFDAHQCRGKARLGEAWLGKAWRGLARRGMDMERCWQTLGFESSGRTARIDALTAGHG